MFYCITSHFTGRPFVKRFALCYRTVVCPVCLSVTLDYCGQTAGWIKMPLGREIGLNPSNIMLNGDPAHPYKRGTAAPPLFSAHVQCGHGRPSQLLLSSCYLRQRGYVIVVVYLSVC